MDQQVVPPAVRLRHVQANGICMQLAEAGSPANPLVLLMHGWPECWFSWRHQLVALGRAGAASRWQVIPGCVTDACLV